MIEYIIHLLQNRFWVELFSLFLYGGGLLGLIKVTIWMYSWRAFSFYWVWKHRDRFVEHEIFEVIDRLSTRKDVATVVIDHAKKEIVSDLFRIEMLKIKQVLKMNLRHIIKKDFGTYMTKEHWHSFKADKLVTLFINEYLDSRNTVEAKARVEFTRNGMSQEHFNRLWALYCEMSQLYEIIITESLSKYYKHRDIYRILSFIMDDFQMLVEIIYKSIGANFNRLNGRSWGIAYKGRAVGEDYAKR
jgi:hypothetical protein